MDRIKLTNLRTKQTAIAELNSAPVDTKIPTALHEIGPGTFSVGVIKHGGHQLIALYNRETSANESDPAERQKHQLHLDALRLKAGDVIGHAVDEEDTKYQFQSV